MPFYEDFDKVFWSVILAFIISIPMAILSIPKENIVYIIIYTIVILIGFEIYFLIKWLLVYRKEFYKTNFIILT